MLKNIYIGILFITAGAIAGYLTNTYAVRWLFRAIKKKGRLSAWDISIVSSEQKKEKLVESLTDCVTESILNSEVLQKGIPDEVINQHLHQWMDKLFQDGLSKQMQGISLEQLPEFAQTEREVRSYLETIMEEQMVPWIRAFMEGHPLSDLIRPYQTIYGAEKVYEILLEEVHENNRFQELLCSVYKEKGDIPLEDWIGTYQWKQMEDHLLSDCLRNVIGNLVADAEGLERCLSVLLETVQAKKLLQSFQQRLNGKKLGDLAEEYSIEQLFLHIEREAAAYLKTPQGRRVIRKFQQDLLELLLSLDEPFGSLLTEESLERLKDWIRQKVPEVLPYLSQLIRENEEELNQVLYDSIRAAAEKNNHAEWMIWLEETIKIWIAGKIQIPVRLREFLDNIKQEDSEAVVEKLLQLITEQKISDFVRSYTKKRRSYAWLSLLKQYGGKALLFGGKKFYGWIKEKPVSWVLDIFSIDFSRLVFEWGKPWILKAVSANQEVIAEKLTDWIAAWIRKKHLERRTFTQVVSAEAVEQKSEEWSAQLERWLTAHKEEMIQAVDGYINKDGREAFTKWQKQNAGKNAEKLKAQLLSWYDQRMNEIKKQPLEEMVKSLDSEPLKRDAVHLLTRQIRLQMDDMVHTQLKIIVSNAFNRLDSDVLCKQVEGLMGGQFQYLSLFGAVIGGLTSILLLPWALSGLSLWGSPISPAGWAISILTMGAIGTVTNVIAIWMIFHPRKPISFLARSRFWWIRVFSQGVIVQNQQDFAKGMAGYVSRELLSEENVLRLYQEQEPYLEEQIQEWLAAKGMQLLKDNKELLAEQAMKALFRMNWLEQKLSIGVGHLESMLVGQLFPCDKLIQLLGEQMPVISEKMEGSLVRWVEDQLANPRSVGDWISKAEPELLSKLLNEVGRRLSSGVEKLSLEDLARDKEHAYKQLISKNWTQKNRETLHAFFDDKMKETNKSRYNQKLLEWAERHCILLLQNQQPIGEVEIFQKTVSQWADILCDQKLEVGIQWVYETIIKKKIEELFGYQESRELALGGELEKNMSRQEGSEDWWDEIKKAVSIFGIQHIMEPIFRDAIWELKEVQLPRYLISKKKEIQVSIVDFLETRVYSLTVSEAVFLILGQNYSVTLQNLLNQTIWRQQGRVQILIKRMAHIGLNTLLQQSPRFYLEMLRMDSLIVIQQRFSIELETIRRQAIIYAGNFPTIILPWILPWIRQIKIQDIFSVWNQEERRQMIHYMLERFWKGDAYHNILAPALSGLYETQIQRKVIGDFIPLDEWKREATKQAFEWINQEVLREKLKDVLSMEIQRFAEYQFYQFPKAFREAIVSQLVSAGSSGIKQQLPLLLKDLEIYQITQERLMALSPQEIEDTIRAFANPIFYQLYVLGVMGLAAGANCYLAWILLAVEEVKKRKDSHKKEEKEQ